jgi:hypothetical protein
MEGEKGYIEKLVKEKVNVKITTKDNKFYAGVIMGLSSKGILFVDKFNNEVYFGFDFIQSIIPTKNNNKKNSEGEGRSRANARRVFSPEHKRKVKVKGEQDGL